MDQIWLVPATIIPSMALLVMSTSARYMSVTLELRKQYDSNEPDIWLADLIYRRASCLQKSLFGFYLAITMFVLASLLLGVFDQSAEGISKGLMVIGVLFLCYAVMHCSYEIFNSRRIIQRDFEKVTNFQKNAASTPKCNT